MTDSTPCNRVEETRDLKRRASEQVSSTGASEALIEQPGVLHGNRAFLPQDEDGQIDKAHSVKEPLVNHVARHNLRLGRVTPHLKGVRLAEMRFERPEGSANGG